MGQIRLLMRKNMKHEITLNDGSCFGEQALINNAPRAATIKCMEKCYFGVLTKAAYQKSIGKILRKQMETQITFLRQCPEFHHWSRTSLFKLFYYWKKVTYYNN